MSEVTEVPAVPEATTDAINREPRAIDKLRAALLAKPHVYTDEETGLQLYFFPLTTADIETVELGKADGESPHTRNLRLLIQKARTADGAPLFTSGDLEALRSTVTFEKVQRMINFMYKAGSWTVPEAKQTLGNTAASGATSSSPNGSEAALSPAPSTETTAP